MKSILKISNAAFFKFLIATFVLSWNSTTLLAQTSATTSQTPEQQLRSLYYRGDVNLLKRDGEAMALKKEASLETRAWFATQALSTSYLRLTSGVTVIEGMQKESPHDPWTLVARSFVTGEADQSIALCEKAIGKDTGEDVLVLCTKGISNQVRTPADGDLLRAYLLRNKQKFESSAKAQVAQAEALSVISWRTKDKQTGDDAIALAERALKTEPQNIRALQLILNSLSRQKKYKEGFDLILSAAPSSESQAIHGSYYYFVGQQENLSKLERARLIEEDARALIEQQEPGQVLEKFFSTLQRMQAPETADEMIELVLKKYPKTEAFEIAAACKASAKLGEFITGDNATPEVRREVVNNVIAYLNRPDRRFEASAIGWSEARLYQILLNTETSDTEQILAAAKAAGAFFTPPLFAQVAARRKANLAELEQLAAKRIDELIDGGGGRSATWRYDMANSDKDLYWSRLGLWYDTLGYVYLQQGRVTEAEPKILAAEKLLAEDLKSNPETLMHLGSLYAAKRNFPKAEEYLSRSMEASYYGMDEHPAIAAYKDLYLKQNGKSNGMDKYMAVVYEKDAVRRKGSILKARIAEPQPIPAFKLASLDGKTYSSEELKGKFVVINFWGTWCAPCVKEMPELQKFYEKYKNHPEVAVLTINSKDTLEGVKQFIALKKYTMPVLLEGEYFNESGISSFPTTWFVDREGKMAFRKIGGTKKLVEEFSWRVEAMLEKDKTANKTAAPK